MKNLLVLFFCLLCLQLTGQEIIHLEGLGRSQSIPDGKSVIYGNFIQRLGFSSGGFPQDIRILNTQSNALYAFRVKSTFKSSKENDFCIVLDPGHYIIVNYLWIQSKWYGGKIFMEPIFKEVDTSGNFEEKLNSGEISESNLERYSFSINPGTLNYLGTWDFNTGLVSFMDEKESLDKDLSKRYKALDFSQAVTILPN